MVTHFRVARPSDDLQALLPFYRDGLGLELLATFADHAGFDGLIFGRPEQGFQIEFTHKRGERAGGAPTEDHLLVFYTPDLGAWEAAVARMRAHGYEPVPAYNPYWDEYGATFADPDGYRVVIRKPVGP